MRPPAAPRVPRVGTPSAGPTRPARPVPSERVERVERVDPVESVEPADPVRSAEPVREPLVVRPATGRLSVLEQRRRERQRAHWRRVAFRAGLATLALAVVAGVVWAAAFSPLLALNAEKVRVTGATGYVVADQVAAPVRAAAGTPLLRLDLGALSEQVEQDPTVLSARITREWPQGVTVHVEPREPVAVVTGGEGEAARLVGVDGVALAEVSAEHIPAGLPELTVEVAPEDSATVTAAVLEVLDGLPQELADQVLSAGATSVDAVTLVLTSGAQVSWGSTAEAELKAEVLLTLLQVPATHYDVRAPLAPITT